jgi:branched-subunit amino acid ABC-type transport system permease component
VLSSLLPFVVAGLVSGSLYGLTATGLVLTYKTSGIVNFAYGAIGAAGAYVFYFLNVTHHWAWPAALIVSVVGLGPLVGLVLERLLRNLSDAGAVLKIVATVGLVLVLQALGDFAYGTITLPYPNFLPTGGITVAGVFIGDDQLITIGVTLACIGAFYAFFRRARLGIGMRAVVDSPDLVALTGTNPNAVRRWAWIIASTFAMLSGVLLAPKVGLDATLLTLVVVQAFGAAAIGRFSNLPLTYLGGLVVGVIASVSTKYAAANPALIGLPSSVPFAVLFVALLLTPSRLLRERAVRLTQTTVALPAAARAAMHSLSGAAPWLRRGARLAVAAGLVLVPDVVGTRTIVWTSGLTVVILMLSLGLLVRTSGQVSLCQMGFAAVGATTFAHLAHAGHAPWLLAVLGAGLVAIPVGVLVALPTVRLTGVFLALATFAFAVLLEQLVYGTSLMFGVDPIGIPAPRPHLSFLNVSSDRGYYYVVLAFTALTIAIMAVLHASRLGRLLRGMSDSPSALSTLGANMHVTRVVVFCISAFFAGISGALAAGVTGFAESSGYGSFNSLLMVVVLVIMPFPRPWYALVAGAALSVVPAYLNLDTLSHYTDWLNIVFGVSAVAVAVSVPKQAARRRRLRGRVTAAHAPVVEPVRQP